jgi:DNA-binding SARP family transcriptional activator
MVPLLQINLLGPARIAINNADITAANWRLTKSRDLLLYLAHQGQPVGINRILDDLWPDLPMEKGLNNFYNALYWLRQVIQKNAGAELITYGSKICQLLPGAYSTDRDRFISLVNAGFGDLKASGGNLQSLEEAVALYQGEYLGELDYPWVVPEREHLKCLFLEAVIRLAGFYLQNQDYLKTVRILEPLIEQNTIREDIFGLLMTAFAKLGDRLAVIRQYQKLKSNLAEELGLEPTPEIKKLYYELCGSDTGSRRKLKKA